MMRVKLHCHRYHIGTIVGNIKLYVMCFVLIVV